MIYMMNTYATNSSNPYARHYLTRGRKNSDNCSHLSSKHYSMEPINKKVKFEEDNIINKHNSLNSESYSFFNDDNELHDNFDELYNNTYDVERTNTTTSENYNFYDGQHIADENCAFVDADIEEYSIDFIEDADSTTIDSFVYAHNPPQYNGGYFEPTVAPTPTRNKRKQGIVGRPTLSSPQRLLVPDNVYSHANNGSESFNTDKYFTDNNYRVRSYGARNVPKKLFQHTDIEDTSQRGPNRTRPRILLKPSLCEYPSSVEPQYSYSPIEQDANEVAQRLVANREFARNLVARAERQGTIVDKNKIPMSVFEKEPVDRLFRSSQLHGRQRGNVAEIKPRDVFMSQPLTTTGCTPDTHRPSPVVTKRDPTVQVLHMTASDILKQKWKDANRK